MAIVADTSLASPLRAAVLSEAEHAVVASPWLRRALVGGDLAALASTWLIAYAVGSYESAGLMVLAMTLAGVWLLQLQHLYLARVASMRSVELAGIARVALMLAAAAIAVQRFTEGEIAFATAALGGGLTVVTLSLWRSMYRGWLRAQRERGKLDTPCGSCRHRRPDP